ncbi:hypothetical protein EYR38_010274 [Pleurotus pulmonarius]|nr:hypothetical protein EYR38_010274 [Pleurotus pulmonarius]
MILHGHAKPPQMECRLSYSDGSLSYCTSSYSRRVAGSNQLTAMESFVSTSLSRPLLRPLLRSFISRIPPSVHPDVRATTRHARRKWGKHATEGFIAVRIAVIRANHVTESVLAERGFVSGDATLIHAGFGSRRTQNQTTYHQDFGKNETNSNKFFERHPVSSSSRCLYNPRNPIEVYLDVAFTPWKWAVMAIFGILPLVVNVGLLATILGIIPAHRAASAKLAERRQRAMPETAPLVPDQGTQGFSGDSTSEGSVGPEAARTLDDKARPSVGADDENDVSLDDRLEIIHSPDAGIHIRSKNQSISTSTTVSYIPKRSILSTKSCSLAETLPQDPEYTHGLGAQLMLALALYKEQLLGSKSRWHGYLQSLPDFVDLPMLWQDGCKDAKEAVTWLVGTEVEKEMSVGSLLARARRFYEAMSRQFLPQDASVGGFTKAFTLVSSRAFIVDAYHGLSMVPIADAFNHSQDNHVHIETDFDVCPLCGALYECPHDDGPKLETHVGQNHYDSCYEMVANSPIPRHSEVFNTYGETLGNAALLARYGFVLDVNENDCITWSMEELTDDADLAASFQLAAHEWESEKSLRACCESSNLVYYSESFTVDGDGKVSHRLWLLCFLTYQRNAPSSPSPMSVLEAQIACEAGMDVDASLIPAVSAIASAVSTLCCTRKAKIKKLSDLGPDADIGEILDGLSDDRPRTRLAVSYVLTEISILECCLAEWSDLVLPHPS